MRGDRLREIREKHGLSQADLAERVNIADEREAVKKYITARQAEIDLSDVMTSAEVCEEFGLSESTVRKAIERGTIPARKSAGTWLIRRSDAEARWGGERVENTRPYLAERAKKPVGEQIPARVIYSHNDQFPAGWGTQQVYRIRPGIFRVVRSVNGYNSRSGLVEGTRESVTIYSFVSDPEPQTPDPDDEYQGLFE